MMVSACSLADRRLIRRLTVAAASAPSRATSAAGSSTPLPGLSMIRTPRKPSAVADQRRARTLSRSTSAASTIRNNGLVKPIAVASASVR